MAHWFDELAKSAGEVEPSRRAALRTAGAGFLGTIAMLAFGGRALADDNQDNNGPKCPAGLANCNGLCRDVAIDPDNCGSCGTVCSGGAVCRKGVCVAQCPPVTCVQCPPGNVNCNGTCVNASTDVKNCGGCGISCQTPPNATATCSNGTCGFVCNAGFKNCSGACVSANACGGCSALPATPGAPCGTCGTYVCNGTDAVACSGDHAKNTCGGCSALPATAGAPCGTCGTFACAGADALFCSGDHAKNACGGCSTLAHPPGTPCGFGSLFNYVCSGPDSTVCPV